MKKILILLLVITSGLILTSCEPQENVIFDSSGQVMSQFVGSSDVQPVVVEGTASTSIKVQVTNVSNSDRAIQVAAGENSTATPNQYVISDLVIPAGEYEGTLNIAGVYDNIPTGDEFVLELKLVGVEGGDVVSNDTFNLTFFRFCPVQIGDYTIQMHDSYGDGWQTTNGDGGDPMTATLIDASGNETVIEFGLCSPYGDGWLGNDADCTPGPAPRAFTDGTTTITVPPGTVDIKWYFPGDRWGEISFEIYAPNGNQIYASGGAGDQEAGELPPLIYCL